MAILGIGGGDGEKKRKREAELAAAEERRKAEEAAEERREQEAAAAEERAREAQEAADAQRERAESTFRRSDRAGQPVDDSTSTGRELDALQSLAEEPEDRDPTIPAYTMTIPEDEIRTSVTIPEDEIRFTPGAPAAPPEDPYARVLAASARMQQGAAPGGRPIDFDALDAQADQADVASAGAAQANLAESPLTQPPAPQGAPQPPAQMPPGPPPPPAATPATAAGGAPAPSLLPSAAPPPPAPLPEQQRQADARQERIPIQGQQIPQDVRTAAMPPGESAASGPLSASLPSQGVDRGDSDEDEARRALRIERTMKALGYLAKLGLGAGALALDARGGSPAAAQMLAAGGGMVGNALIGASPTGQQARISQARAQDERRVQQGQEMDFRRLAQQAAERRQAMLDMQGAQRLDLDARRVAALEEGLDVRRQATESLAADRSARAEAYQESVGSLSASRRAELDRRTQETSPESEMSRTAQAQIRDLRAANPRTVPLSDEQIDSLSWRDAQRWLNAGSTAAGRGRGGAGTGGGGGGSVQTARDILIDNGYSPEAVAAMRSRDVFTEAARVARASAPASATGTVIAGTGEDAVRSGEDVSPTAVQEFRRTWSSSRSAYAAFNVLEEVQREYGARAAVSPEAIGRVAVAVVPLRAMVARVQGTGVINPGEAPLINAALPNPTDLARTLLGQQPAKLAQWREALTTDLDAQMEALGVPPEGRIRALDLAQRARVGTEEREREDAARAAGQPRPEPGGGATTYTIRLPDGRTRTTTERGIAAAAAARGLTVEGL